jgi:hypothetical protein
MHVECRNVLSAKQQKQYQLQRKHKRRMAKAVPIEKMCYCGNKFFERGPKKYCSFGCYKKKLKEYYVKKLTPKMRDDARLRKRIGAVFSCRIRDFLFKAGRKKQQSTFEMLGYTKEQLRAHLFNHFELGMTWENYGKHGWHIDHVKPVSWFKFKSETAIEKIRQCFALENLRPRWGTTAIAVKNGSAQIGNAEKSNKWKG